MIHEGNNTTNHPGSLIVAVAGHTGFIGQIVVNALINERITHYRIPSFRELTVEEISSEIPAGKVLIINCSGSTLKRKPELNQNLFANNTESLRKLIEAFSHRIQSVLHMSTTHLNSPELDTTYTKSKKLSEEYLSEAMSRYSFNGVSLRLPTIWSSSNLKDESLLDDITSTSLLEIKKMIRTPNAIVQIATEKSLQSQVMRFLSGELEEIYYDEANSWVGSIEELIKILTVERDSESPIEYELKEIFNHWKLQKFNF